MATTGALYPGSVATASESPWSDNNWSNATYVQADDTNYASITASTFDSPDQSYVLKAYNFNLSAIPDGSQILGVTVKIRAWYANGAGSIDLVQLLDTSQAKVGTNKASTPQALTTSQADYTFGGAADLWGNALTAAWVKDTDFGVAVGCLAGGTDTDIYIDWITLEVTYRPPIVIGAESYALTGTAVALAVAIPMLSTVYALTGDAVSMSKGRGPLAAGAGGYSITGTETTLKHTFKLSAESGSFTISGTNVVVKRAAKLSVDGSSYSLSGTAVTFGAGNRVLSIGASSYGLTGSNVDFKLNLPIGGGSYELTGSDATPRWGRKLVAGGESYALSGTDVSTEYGRKLVLGGSSYALSGQIVTPKRAGYISLTAGSLAITGSELTLTYIPVGEKKLSAGAGSYEVTGTAVGMTRSVPIDYGDYDLVGTAVTLQKGDLTGKGIIADSGSYAINGTAVGLAYETWFDPGNYFVTGTSANLLYIKYRLTAATRTYTVTGASTLKLEIGMPCSAGSYGLTGSAVDLRHGTASGYTIGIGSREFMIVNWIYDDVNLEVHRSIGAGAPVAPYAVSGMQVYPKVSRALLVEESQYAVTGTDVALPILYNLVAGSGSYSVDGSEAGLTAGSPPALLADGGTYALTGTAVNIHGTDYISLEGEIYALSWTDVSLLKTKKMPAEGGSYDVAGANVPLIAGRPFSAESGDYTLSGSEATLTRPINDYINSVDGGVYTISGAVVGVNYGYILSIGGGSFAVNGTAAGWKRTYVLTAESGTYAFHGFGGRGRRTSTFWRKS